MPDYASQTARGRFCTVTLLAFSCCSLADSTDSLPEGESGIASRYPGDRQIEDDRDVLFSEKFDAPTVQEIAERWDTVSDEHVMSVSRDVPDGSADRQSLLMTHVGGQGTGGQFYRRLLPGHDRVFARFYVKFAHDCQPIHHFGTHLGGFHPPTRWPQGGAGTRPDGSQRFTTGVEPYGQDWNWDFYSYWQGMHVHGDGNYWGTPFLSGIPKPGVEKDRWICVEMMVKVNSRPDARDGEQAFWIDGRLYRHDGQIVSHLGPGFPRGNWTGGWWAPDATSDSSFDGFQWRSSNQLNVNYVWAYLYITQARRGATSRVWFDNIIVARNYIGPISKP